MVTSRETGRWVMPKGWQMDGKEPWEAAEIEALEEAGAVGSILKEPIGQYMYNKVISDQSDIPCVVSVYPILVKKMKRDWKERRERKRRWFAPSSAAKRVWESDLRELLLSIDHTSKYKALISKLV